MDRSTPPLVLDQAVALGLQRFFHDVPGIVGIQDGDGLADGRDLVRPDLLPILPLLRLGRECALRVLEVLCVGLDLLAQGLVLPLGLRLRQPPRRALHLHGAEGSLGLRLLVALGAHQLFVQLGALLLLGGRIAEARLELLQEPRQGLLDVPGARHVLLLEVCLAVQLLPVLDGDLGGEHALQEHGVGLGEAVARNLEDEGEALSVRLTRLDAVAQLAVDVRPQP
mmetsp:Transcript_47597/g.120596  ORF Transcript_47597/g.120596 Transcript_47597/m.120596 type:complete len:225 (-) Transcript_47597:538-1212(-)